MDIVDYLFYRIYSFYKTKKDSNPILMGCTVITMTIYLNLLSIIIISGSVLKRDYRLSKIVIFIFLFLGVLLLTKRYFNKELLQLIENKFRIEDKEARRRKGIVIFLYIIISVLTPIAYGILKHNFKYDI